MLDQHPVLSIQCFAVIQREQFERALEAGTDYSLPRNQRIEDAVDFGSGPAPALAAPIPPNNKGYMLLQKMGWKSGSGLGKGEDGAHAGLSIFNFGDVGVCHLLQEYFIQASCQARVLAQRRGCTIAEFFRDIGEPTVIIYGAHVRAVKLVCLPSEGASFGQVFGTFFPLEEWAT
jgi:hypothetical protein